MKKTMSILMVVLTLVFTVSTVLAGPTDLPGGGWWSPFQIQNVGEGDATVTYTAYWQVGQGGAESDTVYDQDGTVTIASGASATYNPALPVEAPRIGFNTTDNHLPSGFAGGVAIASDEPLRAVVTVNNFQAGSLGMGVEGGRASAYYQSVQEPGDTLNFPVFKNAFFGQHTSFYIQAAGEDAVIDATFYYGDSSSTVTGVNIPAGKTYLLDPSAATPAIAEQTLGSLSVVATSGSIAGVVIETQSGVDVGTFALSTKGFTPSDADTVVVAPTNKAGYFGGSTGWQLQNANAVDASATVTFTISGVAAGSAAATAGIAVGDQFVADITVPANGSYLFSTGNGNYYKAMNGTTALAEGVFFSGLAVSSQPLVATVNENNGANRILYSAFGASNATTKLAAPAVKELFFGGKTSLNIQNVGSSTTTPSAVYACGSDAPVTIESYKAIAPGEAVNFFMLSDADHNANGWNEVKLAESKNCAVTVTASEPIVAVAQESSAQDTKNYEGFSLTP